MTIHVPVEMLWERVPSKRWADADNERLQNYLARKGMSIRAQRETTAQVMKWGIQHHPDGTGGMVMEDHANRARALCDRRAKTGDLTWRDILLEEVYEACAESDPAALVTELIQVAAVAISWAVDVEGRTMEGRP